MREIAAWLTVVTLTIGTIRYSYLLFKQRVKSSPAGWSISALAVTISYLAYWKTPHPTWLGNIGHLTGAIEIWIVLGLLLWSLRKRGELVIEFDHFQWACVFASGLILLIWKLTNQAALAFWMMQALLVVSYTAVVGKLIQWKKNLDSTVQWAAVFLASGFGLIPALIDGDFYGIANSIRAITCSGTTLIFCLKLDHENRAKLAISTKHE